MQDTAPSQPQEQHDLLTADDVTRMLRIDKSTAYRMAEDGRLPAFKVGRQWRFRAADVASVLGHVPAGRSPEPFDLDRATALCALVADLHGVMVLLTDLDGRPLSGVMNPNEYFALLSTDPSVVDACTTEWRDYAADADLRPRLLDSHLGFGCVRAFIREGDRLAGMVMAGGIALTTAPDPDLVEALAGAHGIDPGVLLETASALPFLDEHGIDDLCAAVSVLARHISNDPRRPT